MNFLHAMLDDQFQVIIQNDEVLNDLEKQKNDKTDEFFQLMSIISKTFFIDGVACSVITPAIWSFLYCLGNAYAKQDREIEKIDTDVFIYLLHNGIIKADENIITNASGFCASKKIDYEVAKEDLKNLIYIAFRPLEMLSDLPSSDEQQEIRFNADWLTKVVSVVAPLTNLTVNDIIYNLSLTQCFYYYIQQARKADVKHTIKRKNSDEINKMIYQRTMQLGQKYFQEHYGDNKQ